MGVSNTITISVPSMRMKHLREFVLLTTEASDDALVTLKSVRYSNPTDPGDDTISVTIPARSTA